MAEADADDRITLGLVGLGFGRWVLELDLLGAGAAHIDTRAVCDAKPAALAEVEHLAPARYTSIDDLLADDSIEAVALLTGPNGRADLIRRVLATGRHVMTTKPFERDATAAEAVLTEAVGSGLVLHANSPGPELPPDIARMQAWRDEHDLGRVVGARWDTSCSYREAADGSWYDDPDACPLAPVFRIGVYGLNELAMLLGAPQAVQALSTRLRTGRPTADNAVAVLRYPDGALGTVTASFCVDDGVPYQDELTLWLERGTITRRAATGDRGRVAELSLQRSGDATEEATVPRQDSAPFRWDLFRRAIREPGSVPSVIPADVTVAGVRTIEALARAEQSGAVEALEQP